MDRQTTLLIGDTTQREKMGEAALAKMKAFECVQDATPAEYEFKPPPPPMPMFATRGMDRDDPAHPKNAFQKGLRR